ncbi:MAG TPA: DUF4397 domain-containing protein [Flavisolibacter sp.]|nr:DUF4397 domain-containing protein [Flavisolibacter sp.]
MKQLLWRMLAIAGLGLVFTGCDDDDDDDMNQGTARVMVVHASPNAPNVDVRINNSIALTNVAYPNNSPYTNVNAGNTNIKVSATGNSTTFPINADVNLAANTSYSVFAIDSVAKLKPAVVVDNLATPAAGKAHVRFFHFSANAPAVDIALAGGAVLFGNRMFNDQATNANVSAFTPLDAGTYNLEVRLAGTNTVVLPLPGVTLTAGKIYTVFAKGFVGGSGVQALGAQIIANN